MDFETGKLADVAHACRPNRKREYRLLCAALLLGSIPYAICCYFWPLGTLCVMGFMAYFQVLMTFATSTNSDTAHHIRFLLCGSNPIGMTGASSLLFGAVDAVVDWREDAGARNRSPLKFWALSIYKLLMTPIGLLLMVAEFAWDAFLMRRPSLVPIKFRELFSLADYHDLICPEKSNDIFFADLACARHRDDVNLYQWHRLRAMVFELKHYSIDAIASVGVPETNLFLQSDEVAYQILKRLRLEEIERNLHDYYEESIDNFPVPESLARQLVRNARPIQHYLDMNATLNRGCRGEFVEQLGLCCEGYQPWHVLRAIDANPEKSRYLNEQIRKAMYEAGILSSPGGVALSSEFGHRVEAVLAEKCESVGSTVAETMLLERMPSLVSFGHLHYQLVSPSNTLAYDRRSD